MSRQSGSTDDKKNKIKGLKIKKLKNIIGDNNNNNNKSDEDEEDYYKEDFYNNQSNFINFEPFGESPLRYDFTNKHNRTDSLNTIESSAFSSDSEDDSNSNEKKRKGKKIKGNNNNNNNDNKVEPILKEVKSKVAETNSPVEIKSKKGQIIDVVKPNIDDSKNNDNDDNININDDGLNLNKEEKKEQKIQHFEEQQESKESDTRTRGTSSIVSVDIITPKTKNDDDDEDHKDNDNENYNKQIMIDVPNNHTYNNNKDDYDDYHLKKSQLSPTISYRNVSSSEKKSTSSSTFNKTPKLLFCCFSTWPITFAFNILKRFKKSSNEKDEDDDLESGKKGKKENDNNNTINLTNKSNHGSKEKRKHNCCCLIIFLIIIIILLLGNMIYLDVQFASIQTSSSPNNITQVIYSSPSNNTSDPIIKQLDMKIKSVACMTLLSVIPPKQYPCDFCSNDSVVFNNVSSLCVLKSIWANSNNQTSLEQNLKWMNDSNYCQWTGVTCDTDQNIIGLEVRFPNTPITLLDNLGKLTNLQQLTITGDTNIPKGTIPTSLLQLGSLNNLRLETTGLNGPIPDTFDKMTSLKTLQLINNGKLGTQIPASIGSLSLSTLAITQQSLSGTIPDFIGQSKTLQASLQFLDLSSNKLTGNLPNSLMQLNLLKTLNLNNNQLSGNIPATLGQAKFQNTLTTLDLSSNAFQNKIPDFISEMENLSFLYLQINKLNGPIPNSFAKLSKLSELILNNNQLTGNIPDALGSLQLTKLILSNNTLTGVVPTSVCQRQYTICDLTSTSLTSPVKCNVCTVTPPVTTLST